jgi:hypothetical protein
MASYGKNFDFRVPPQHGQRGGRYAIPADAENDIAIGAPVKWTGDETDLNGCLPVDLATGGSAPIKGQCGVLVFEADNLAGLDPLLNSASDLGVAPRGKLVQVVSGDAVKVVFKNTEDHKFLTVRDYKGKTMVADAENISVGDYLEPGVGTDTGGYWAVTSSAEDAWLVVEGVDATRGEIEARFTF